jgi:hypothetical protein
MEIILFQTFYPHIQGTDSFVCSGHVKLPAKSCYLQMFIMVGETPSNLSTVGRFMKALLEIASC